MCIVMPQKVYKMDTVNPVVLNLLAIHKFYRNDLVKAQELVSAALTHMPHKSYALRCRAECYSILARIHHVCTMLMDNYI